MPKMVGGVLYEHGHRMIAGATCILTIGLALWTWLVDKRGWIRTLAWIGLSTILIQAILGGITVLDFLPPAVSTAHALVGQTFFVIAVVIALFTGRHLVEEEPHRAADSGRPTLVTLTFLSVGILYVQLILGGMYRHKGMGWEPHVLNAILVVALLTWTAVRTLTNYSDVPALRRPAILMLGVMLLQVGLGFLAFVTKVIEGATAPQPEPAMVWSTVSHVAVGALLLATTVVLAVQAYRHLAVPSEQWVEATAARGSRISQRATSAPSTHPGATA
jgi:cytochrome c oxidase assembly protein subunit 15